MRPSLSNSTDTFEHLYGRYHTSVRRLLRKHDVPEDRVDDLTQEVFIRLHDRLASYRGDVNWQSLERISLDVLLGSFGCTGASRRRPARISLADHEDPQVALVYSIPDASDPGAELLRQETVARRREHLKTMLTDLSPDLSETLRLWLTGLKQREIAEVTGAPYDVVRSRLKTARRFVRVHTERSIVPFGHDTAIIDDLLEAIGEVSISTPQLIFAPPNPSIHLPQMLISVEDALIRTIQRDPNAVFGISSRAFEMLLAEIFKRQGFEVELTKATRDGGRDIIAIHEILGIRSKYIIECKRYAPHRKVALQFVQRLYGVKVSEGANKAILATTSSFTRDAAVFASHHVWDLELKAFNDIMAWIRACAS